ncbi:protoporphyrinogen oxidase [Desulfogranum japonicum]|uniref:protoporphyrinogen oxidase n=1 Tax=Desulfogranum japonicum TaxID=231447 RepID=UPI0003F949EC|nr:protoporphyrinogen oxidase [Desulfogranum japonicum]
MSTHSDICILGGGISGLSAATFLCHHHPEIRITLLEKNATSGGAIQSYKQDGYLAEWGPHGFLDNCKESKELIQWAGLETQKELAPLNKFVRYVCLQGKLQCIPQKPLKILGQPLIPVSAKLRVLADLWKTPLQGEPTVAQWIEYRFGKHLLPFADAVFTGTYAGDIQRLKIDAVMPGVRQLEQQAGSVIRGILHKLFKAKKNNTKKQGKKGLPSMTSFAGGMGQLPIALSEALARNPQVTLHYNSEAVSIVFQDDRWIVETADTTYTCTDLLVALPINACLPLLQQCPNIPTPPSTQVPEAAIASVLLGFNADAHIPFGFGYLAPEQENRFLLGALFSSHMFPGRAPEGMQLVEALVGGRRHPERLQLTDEELVSRAYEDLSSLMDLPAQPVYSHVLRSTAAIPQLEENATTLFHWREELHATFPHLHICGFGWKGIGLNDMIKEGAAMAERCVRRQTDQAPELKAVYF